MSDFKDILVELEKIRDIVFMTKSWKPVKAYNQGQKLTVDEIRPLVVKSTKVLQMVDKISEEKGEPKNELIAKVKEFLDEMGHKKNMTVIRWVGLALCKLIPKNYLGVLVDEDSVTKAKSVMGTNPVIFAPSHRSYCDFILMSFLCYYYDIEIPSIAAGMDFKGMWGIGDILRDCGAFFIKRTFGGDELYKATFHEYITKLVTSGESAVEFFIEGTRSRTGKSLVPKFGLLSAALEQYFNGKVPDVTIIPVSITYERVLEEKLFANELMGVPKPKESTRLLFKALKILNDNYGHVFVKFGTPISVLEYCNNCITEDPRIQINQLSPFRGIVSKPNIGKIVENLGYEIVYAQNNGMQYTSIHKLAACLSGVVIFHDVIPVSCIMDDMMAIQSVLHSSESGQIPDVALSEVKYCIDLHKYFIMYDKENDTIRLRKFSLLAGDTESTSSKGYGLLPSTADQVYPIILLQQYANSVCSKCCNVSLLTCLVYTTDEDVVCKDDLMDEYMGLRSLFCTEFVLQRSETSLEKDYYEAVSMLLKFGLLQENCDNLNTYIINKGKPGSLAHTREMVLMGIIYPFIEGYWMTIKECCKMRSETDNRINVKQFIKDVQCSIETNMTGLTLHGYTLSMDLIFNALNSFAAMGVIRKIKLSPVDTDLCIELEKCYPIMNTLDPFVFSLWEILVAYSKRIPEIRKIKCNL